MDNAVRKVTMLRAGCLRYDPIPTGATNFSPLQIVQTGS